MISPANPFKRWNLDPSASLKELTKTMRQRIADLDGEERQALQEEWRKLTSDPVYRARWIALTPPPVADVDDPWEAARQLARPTAKPRLEALEPTLDDALVLPLLDDGELYAPPPFLPATLCEKALPTEEVEE